MRYLFPSTTQGSTVSKLRRIISIIAVAALAVQASAMGRPARKVPIVVHETPVQAEAVLAKTLLEIRNNRLDAALLEVDKAIHGYPNFRLAHLIRGDLLAARARPLQSMGDAPNAPRDQIQDLRDEARARLARYQLERPTDRVPKYLVQMNAEQKHALVVDMSMSTLYVFENRNGAPHYVGDYYVSGGKNGADKMQQGDKKTPLGVYHVTSTLSRKKLGDFYGIGAFPISYPNEWDRREGRNGNGIWLHGVPSNTYSRPPRASDGCVVLTNQDLEALSKKLQIGITPVIIADRIEWANPGALEPVRKELLERVESWRKAWESRDTAAYLTFYAPNFSSGAQNLAAYSQQKRQVNAGKTWIKVKLNRLSVFLYPERSDLAVINFEQDYSSNNLSNEMKKRQYWIRTNGDWRIVYEGAA